MPPSTLLHSQLSHAKMKSAKVKSFLVPGAAGSVELITRAPSLVTSKVQFQMSELKGFPAGQASVEIYLRKLRGLFPEA